MKLNVHSSILDELLLNKIEWVHIVPNGNLMCPGEEYREVLIFDETGRRYYGGLEIAGQPENEWVPIKIWPAKTSTTTHVNGKTVPLLSSWDKDRKTLEPTKVN